MDMIDQLIDKYHPVTVCKASAGTGKTYTLAAYYVGLLLSGEDYRSILAITFTNKATAEMNERILTYLYALSKGEEKAFLDRARAFMLRDADMPDAELARRAGVCFERMLIDFDNVHVMTIDAFLQSLLSGLAGILQTSAGTSTELDVKHVVKEAVDQLLSNTAIINTHKLLRGTSARMCAVWRKTCMTRKRNFWTTRRRSISMQPSLRSAVKR